MKKRNKSNGPLIIGLLIEDNGNGSKEFRLYPIKAKDGKGSFDRSIKRRVRKT